MASSFQMSGMVSGIDTKSMIQSLLAIERQPLTGIETKISKNETKLKAIQDVNTQLTALKTSLATLIKSATYSATSASTSNSGVVSMSSTSSALAGTYKLLEVSQLATATKIKSSAGLIDTTTTTLAAANFDVTPVNGTFVINDPLAAVGEQDRTITYNTTDTIDQLIANINSQLDGTGPGFADTNIRASYDNTTDRIKIERTDAKNSSITFSDTAGNLSQVLGLNKVIKQLDSSGNAYYTSTYDTRNSQKDIGGKIDPTKLLTDSLAKFGTTPSNGSGDTGLVTIDGVQISYNVNTQSLNTIIGNINSALSAAGKNITASYDSNTDRFSLERTDGTVKTISLGSGSDKGNLLQVLQLSTATQRSAQTGSTTNTVVSSSVHLSTVKSTEYLTSTNANFNSAITAGEFTINGTSITVASTDTLSTLLSKINTSEAGVSATYDVTTDKISLTSKTTGASSISFGSDTSGFLKAAGLTSDGIGTKVGYEEIGKNAVFKIEGMNGGEDITRSTNSVSDLITGVTLNLNKTLLTTDSGYEAVTMTVSNNTSTASNAISDFVQKLNNILSSIKIKSSSATFTNGKKTGEAGPLNGDSVFMGIRSTLIQNSTSGVSGLTGTYKSLTDIGITLNSSSELSIDTSKLNTALSNNITAVSDLFTNSTYGIGTMLNTYVTGLTDASKGSLQKSINDLNSYNKNLTDQVDRFEERLAAMETRLNKQFAGVEEAFQKMQSQTSFIAGQLGGTSSSASLSN